MMIVFMVYIDGDLILDPENRINKGITSGELSLEVNTPGSFNFTLLKTYTNASNFKMKRTLVAVREKLIDDSGTVVDDFWPYVGRIVSIENDIYGNISCQSEGAIAFLKDMYYLYDWKKLNQDGLTVNEFIDRLILYYWDHTRHILENYQGSIPINPNIIPSIAYTDRGNFLADATYLKIYNTERNDSSDYVGTIYECFQDVIINRISGFLGVSYQPCTITDSGASYTPKTNYEVGDGFAIYMTYYIPQDIRNIDTTSDNLISYTIYYDDIDYDNPNNMPSDNYIRTDIDPISFPTFSQDKNIKNIETKFIKDDIWTCLLPLGKDDFHHEWKSSRNPPGYEFMNDLIPMPDLIRKHGVIIKSVTFSNDDTSAELYEDGIKYIEEFVEQAPFDYKNYYIDGIEPCLVGSANKIIRLGYPANVRLNGVNKLMSVISISHDIFDAEKSKYVLGFNIADSIINEDISRITIERDKDKKTKARQTKKTETAESEVDING